MEDDGEMVKLIKVWLTAALSGCYCYTISKTTSKGFLRLLLILPVTVFFTVAPYYLLTYRHLSGITWFFLTWLGISKLLLFSFGVGPLAPAHYLPFHHFLCTLLFPIKIRPDKDGLSGPGPLMWVLVGAKMVAFGCVIQGYKYRETMSFWGLMGLYCCHLYLSLQVLLVVTWVIARASLGSRIDTQGDKAYLSSSLQDFWGRRWNLIISDVLRQTVHNPVRRLAMPFIGKKTATLVSVFASFLVSGLMHEWLFAILTRATPTWEVTWFFVLHGLCLVVEMAIGNKWRIHRVVLGSFKVGFIAATAAWLLFPPLLRNKVHERFVEEYAVLGSFLKENVLCVFV